MKTSLEIFAQNLRDTLEAQRKSQSDLARHTGATTVSVSRWINESKVEKWLLENVEEDFKVQVTMKPKEKREDPKKYKDRLARLNDMYLLGNISQKEYEDKSAELQRKIAELSKNAPLKTQNFASNWKDLYLRLDDEHRRSFWQNLIAEIVVNQQGQGFKILY